MSQAAESRTKRPELQEGYMCPNKVDATQRLDNELKRSSR